MKFVLVVVFFFLSLALAPFFSCACYTCCWTVVTYSQGHFYLCHCKLCAISMPYCVGHCAGLGCLATFQRDRKSGGKFEKTNIKQHINALRDMYARKLYRVNCAFLHGFFFFASSFSLLNQPNRWMEIAKFIQCELCIHIIHSRSVSLFVVFFSSSLCHHVRRLLH